MRTVVTILVEHTKPIPLLAKLIEGRAYTIDGVTNASQVVPAKVDDLLNHGFTMAEISLGLQEVARG